MAQRGRGQLRKPAYREKLRIDLLRAYGRYCHWCGDRMTFPSGFRRLESDMTFEHLIGISRGGKTEWDNLRLACFSCNQKHGGGYEN